MSEVHKFYIKGHEVLIDKDKVELVLKYRWFINGSTKKGFYVIANTVKNNKKTCVSMHRYLMNAKEGQIVDHINRNTFDNRLENLRFCTHRENSCNRTSKKNSSSKFLGVSVRFNKHTTTFKSSIRINGVSIGLGIYNDEIKAAKAYNEAAIKYHGEFANLNKFE